MVAKCGTTVDSGLRDLRMLSPFSWLLGLGKLLMVWFRNSSSNYMAQVVYFSLGHFDVLTVNWALWRHSRTWHKWWRCSSHELLNTIMSSRYSPQIPAISEYMINHSLKGSRTHNVNQMALPQIQKPKWCCESSLTLWIFSHWYLIVTLCQIKSRKSYCWPNCVNKLLTSRHRKSGNLIQFMIVHTKCIPSSFSLTKAIGEAQELVEGLFTPTANIQSSLSWTCSHLE